MKASLLLALGLFFVIEGLFPFFFPKQWRETFLRIAELNTGQIRFFGLLALLCGILLLSFLFFSAEP